jgi:hypothetical protein
MIWIISDKMVMSCWPAQETQAKKKRLHMERLRKQRLLAEVK